MENMSKSLSTRIDRLSNLPDHVAHKVFSFLSMEDIFRLSGLSKRCRQLCISIPFLIFDDSLYKSGEIKRTQLINYLERLLFVRQGMDIQHFKIRWNLENCGSEEEHPVLSWLHTAVKCNVRLLDLDIVLRSESDFALPPSLLGCLCLKYLTMKFQNGTGILKIPSSITSSGFSSLKSIELQHVQICDSFGDWVSSYCKFLTKLSLTCIRGAKRIIITSSSLTSLKIYLPYDLFHVRVCGERLQLIALMWRFDSSPDNRDLQLSTPKLKKLFGGGDILICGFMENNASLVTAQMILTPSYGLPSFAENLARFFRLLHNVRHLALNECCLYVLSKQDCLPISFPSLLTLRIGNKGSMSNLEPVLAPLLKGTPNLQSLLFAERNSLSASKLEYDKTKRCWDFKNIPFLHNLKFVTIEHDHQGENDLYVIKYLLKHAKNLRKMTVSYDSSLQADVSREIYGCEKASSDAEVLACQV